MKTIAAFKHVATFVSCVTLAACAGNQPMPEAAGPVLPDWVANPVVENGIADTQCVRATQGVSMSTLKAKATALARSELARQIGIKVKAMDKTFQRLTETNQGDSHGSTFESVSKQVTQQHLAGSRAIQQNYVKLPPDNADNYCVMVAMSPELTETLFKDLVAQFGRNLSPTNEAVLYEQFLMKKATEEMENELKSQQP